MTAPGFWDDQDQARDVVQRVKGLKDTVESFEALEARLREAAELEELLAMEPDAQLDADLTKEL
ncbi:MAG TPA: PCRF domain-containing protein, partial [Gemmatimonadaceae bacterium]|nr:PCRF domain-containing protein [Gemmatimonadaceae bacterium]